MKYRYLLTRADGEHVGTYAIIDDVAKAIAGRQAATDLRLNGRPLLTQWYDVPWYQLRGRLINAGYAPAEWPAH